MVPPEGDCLAYLSTDEEQPERWMEVWLYSVGGGRLVGKVRLEPQDIGSSQGGRVLGDAYPAWSRDGKELYYLTLAGVYRVDLREFAPTGTRPVQLRGRQVAKADAFPSRAYRGRLSCRAPTRGVGTFGSRGRHEIRTKRGSSTSYHHWT